MHRIRTPRFRRSQLAAAVLVLAAAGAISLSDTARLLKLRGQAMQRAVPVGEGPWPR